MKRGAFPAAVLAIAATIALGSPLAPLAFAQEEPPPTTETAPTERRLPPHWIDRVFPTGGLPTSLAIRFGKAALTAGITPGQAARLLSDDRFVLAVGSPDQGWGLLEGMIDDPATIADAWEAFVSLGARLTISGTTSLQSAIIEERPELRNAYLEDLGLMFATRSDGVDVLVDLETGRQALGDHRLGAVITAPGGGPLPTPALSPAEVEAQMWADAGIDPNDPNPARTLALGPDGPGMNTTRERPPDGLMSPAIWLLGGSFLLVWLGYAAIMVTRRLRRD